MNTRPTPVRDATIADYAWLYAHTDYMAGTALKRAKEALAEILDQMPATLCDVGGGRDEFAQWIIMNANAPHVASIDPATGASSCFDRPGDPHPFDLVTCFDVLEHLQPDDVEDFIRWQLGARCRRRIYATICTDPEVRQVNGEWVTLHTCLRPPHWWQAQCAEALPGWTIRLRPCEESSRFLFILEHP